MIGNNVTISLNDRTAAIDGELRKLDATGAMVYIHGMLPEQDSLKFIPMHLIVEIVDRGRTNR